MDIPTSVIGAVMAASITVPQAALVPVPSDVVDENVSVEATRQRFIGIVEHGLEGAVIGGWRIRDRGLLCKMETILGDADSIQHFTCFAGTVWGDNLFAPGGTQYLGTFDMLIQISEAWAERTR